MKKTLLLICMLFAVGNMFAQDELCSECWELEIDPVCGVDSSGVEYQLPNACFLECLGLEETECDSIVFEDGPFEDCDCVIDPAEEWICILTDEETGLICPFPNLCVAECQGYSEDQIVECENFDWDFENGIDTILGCILECGEEQGDELICVADEDGNQFLVPNVCVAECLGLEIVDCDSSAWDWDWDYTDTIDWDWNDTIDWDWNDSIDWDWDWNDSTDWDWPWDDSTDVQWDDSVWTCILECETDFSEIFCAEDADGNVVVVFSECEAECLGLSIVECDSSIFDWPGDQNPCGCEIDPEEEWICILTDEETGTICPFPNLCFAECEGYTADQIVECQDDPIGGGWEIDIDSNMFECLFECDDTDWDPEDVVCVTDGQGNEFSVPNECFANCLDLEIVDCNEGIGVVFEEHSLEDNGLRAAIEADKILLTSYPNPVVDEVVVSLEVPQAGQGQLRIVDLTGIPVYQANVTMSTTSDMIRVDASNFQSGIYTVIFEMDNKVQTERFIK